MQRTFIALGVVVFCGVASVVIGCSAGATVDADSAAPATLDLTMSSAAAASSDVVVLVESANGMRERRSFSLDANQSLTATFALQTGEALVAIGCLDDNGNALLGAGTAKLDVESGDKLQLSVAIDELIAGNPAGLEGDVGGSVDADGDVGVDGDCSEATGECAEGGAEASVSGDVAVSISGDQGECDTGCQAECDALVGSLL